MKLIFCPFCEDIVKLVLIPRYCSCGKSGGHYQKDRITAVIYGDAVPLGIANFSFHQAFRNQPETGMGERFDAFVIPKECDHIKRSNQHENRSSDQQRGSGVSFETKLC